jgi:cysteine desulfurase
VNLPIYLDYAATTPVDPRVAEKMMACLTREGNFGNAASRTHALGWRAEAAVEDARAQVAELIHCDPREIVWTSGATESDNLALKGGADFYQRRGKHIITNSIEHKAVLDSCKWLETQGFEVTYLSPNTKGVVELDSLKNALRDETILVSMMHVNNELGSVAPIAEMGELCREKKIIFHVDAAQSLGKIDIDLQTLKVDLMSFSSHKLYGPKGIGALFIRRKPRVRLTPQLHGGGHERGYRSGTLATHQIVGFGQACALAKAEMAKDYQRIKQLRDRLWAGVKDIDAVSLNGDFEHGYPGILNFSVNFIEGESLVMALKDLAISTGSACTSASLETSYVLRALGLSDELAHSSLRFSIGRFTTADEIDYAIMALNSSVEKLRAMSPLWDMHKQGIDLSTIEWGDH